MTDHLGLTPEQRIVFDRCGVWAADGQAAMLRALSLHGALDTRALAAHCAVTMNRVLRMGRDLERAGLVVRDAGTGVPGIPARWRLSQ